MQARWGLLRGSHGDAMLSLEEEEGLVNRGQLS